jgi:DNA ligase (NAD+)
MIIERIKELTEELLHHCYLYYDLDSPILSDTEYDKKYNELEKLENEANFWLANSPTRKVQGSVLDCFTKVEHSKPMLSAAKTKDINEIKKFIGDHTFYCSFKLDGLTLVVRYREGKFVQAVTRGTGIIGEDVTEQAKMIPNLPMCIPYDGDLELRGECVVSWDNFNKINEKLENKYSHPRNLAAGSLRNLDTNITKERSLSYLVFECVTDLEDIDGLMDSKYLELKWLKHIGFDIVEACMTYVDECVRVMDPKHYIYPVDGLIFELNSRFYSKSLESTSHHEGCRMALKWADEIYETTLLDVEWNPTRTGLISPVAIFDEVDLDGALTTRATLHNLSIIKQLELGIGDTITVYRSNMVIPKVDDNLTRSNTLTIPEKCPCCGAKTIIKDTDNSQVLMCPNLNCSAKKIAQFTHFVSRKCMNIDGLSEKTLETLLSHGFIHKFKDIYHLSDRKQQLVCLDGFGKKSVEKLLKSIKDSRNVKLENFIAALGINGVGLSAAKTISNYCNGSFDTFNDLLHRSYEGWFDWTTLEDFGEITSSKLDAYWYEHASEIRELAKEMNFIVEEKSTDNSLDGIKFCITGSFSQPRDGLKKQLESRGAKFISSVSKNLDILFAGEKAGSKLTKAQQLGVRVANEDELMEMLS